MDNKTARLQLEKIYGKGCMLEKAEVDNKLKKLNIKTYKKFINETHYKSKKILQLKKTMTYHHLIHRSEGGKTSLVNGAELSALAHIYIHSLPRHEEEIINNMLRQYKHYIKIGAIQPTNTGINIDNVVELELSLQDDDCIIIPLEKNKDKDKKKKKIKYNRAKEKIITQNKMNEELYSFYEER